MNTPIDLIAANLSRERQRLGLSLGELARQAGVAKSTLSQLEAGNGNPSVETLWSLCVALNIPFSGLMAEPQTAWRLIRRGAGPAVASEHSDYQTFLLATSPPGVRRDIYQIECEPGETHHSQAHQAGTIEHVIITRGRALAGLAEEPVTLAEGDYLCYPADGSHLFQALEPGTRAVMIIELPG